MKKPRVMPGLMEWERIFQFSTNGDIIVQRLDPKVKKLLDTITVLIMAKMRRKELCYPCIDINLRLWWHMHQLRRVEAAHHEMV